MTSWFHHTLLRLLIQPGISAQPSTRKPLWFVVVAWLALMTPAQAAVELRVNIQDGIRQIQVGSSTNAVVRDGSGRTLGSLPARSSFVAQTNPRGVTMDRWQSTQLWVEPTGGGYVWIGDRWYRGRVQVLPVKGSLMAINHVDLEQYLYSVLGGEMGGNWPLEALKAQAVASRSYVLYKRQRTLTSLFDVGDTTTWQVYRGLQDESTGTQAAVNATAGQVLTANGQIAEAVFHSSSGGSTENSEEIWSAARPYLRAVPDYDQGSPVFQWSRTVTSTQLRGLISGVGDVISMTPVRTTSQGRVITMRVVGTAGTRTISGDTLRSALNLRSTRFTVAPQGSVVGAAGKAVSTPAAFQINGLGFGHGLGMSQWGAYNLALQGYNYQQILGHYYRNTALARVQPN